MADIALKEPMPTGATNLGRRMRIQDALFHGVTQFFALVVLLLLGGVVVSLIIGSWPAITTFGFGFLVTEVWNPVTDQFGALAPVYGTIVTSVIAMVIAVPIGIMVAFFAALTVRPARSVSAGAGSSARAGVLLR